MKDHASYLTLSQPVTGEYKEKGSRFYAYAYPLSEIQDAESCLDLVKDMRPGARHYCYAYRFHQHEKAYDDGEPRHSAGDPILNQIRSASLDCTMVIVVRYFGGTKLGLPGLIRAYKSCAAEALQRASPVRRFPSTSVTICFPYNVTAQVNQIIHSFQTEEEDAAYSDVVQLKLRIATKDLSELTTRLEALQGLRLI